MAKEFLYRGKTLNELKNMPLEEVVELLPSSARRRIKRRGFTEEQKKLREDLKKNKGGKNMVRTHCRNMIILPEMAGMTVGVYDGKEFKYVAITEDMVGHMLGEYALTRKYVKHSGPGIGATRSTKFISVR